MIPSNNGIAYFGKGTILMYSHFHAFLLVEGTRMKMT